MKIAYCYSHYIHERIQLTYYSSSLKSSRSERTHIHTHKQTNKQMNRMEKKGSDNFIFTLDFTYATYGIYILTAVDGYDVYATT